MKNFKEFVETITESKKSEISGAVDDLISSANIQDKDVLDKLNALKQNPNINTKKPVRELLSRDWENGKEQAKNLLNLITPAKKTVRGGLLNSLLQNKKISELIKKLKELTSNENQEIAKLAGESLPIAQKLKGKLKPSVVSEADAAEQEDWFPQHDGEWKLSPGDQEMYDILDRKTKSLDTLLPQDDDTAYGRLNEQERQGRLREILKAIINKYNPRTELENAVLFFQDVAKITNPPNKLSYNELVTVFDRYKNNGIIAVKGGKRINIKNQNFQNAMKFLFGCLILRFGFKSDTFTQKGAFRKISNLNDDTYITSNLEKINNLTVDNDILNKFEKQNKPENFISEIENFFVKIDNLDTKEIQKISGANVSKKSGDSLSAGTVEKTETTEKTTESPETTEKTTESPETTEKTTETTESPETQNAFNDLTRFNFDDITKKDEKGNLLIDKKVEDVFGTNSSLLNSYIQKAERALSIALKKVENNKKLKESEETIYNILNERLLADIKNKFAIGRTNFGEKDVESINKNNNDVINDMRQFQTDYHTKAIGLAEIAKKRTNSVSARENAITKLNKLISTFQTKLRDCAIRAEKQATTNELGLLKKDITNDLKKAGNFIATKYKNSRIGQTQQFKTEQDQKTADKFDEIWAKLNDTDKKTLAYAINKGNFMSLQGASILNPLDGAGQPDTQTVDEKIHDIGIAKGYTIEKSSSSFLKMLKNSEFYKQHEKELSNYTQQYEQYVKGYNVLSQKFIDIINGTITGTNNATQQNATQQNAPQQNAPQQNATQQNAIVNKMKQGMEQKASSVVTEDLNSQNLTPAQIALGKLLNNIKDEASLKKLKEILGITDWKDEIVINSILQFKKPTATHFSSAGQISSGQIKKLAQYASAQPTVTTAAVSPLPARLFTKAMRRKIED